MHAYSAKQVDEQKKKQGLSHRNMNYGLRFTVRKQGKEREGGREGERMRKCVCEREERIRGSVHSKVKSKHVEVLYNKTHRDTHPHS